MILREILAAFGLEFDKHGAEEAEHSIDHIHHAFEGLKSAVEASVAFELFHVMTEAASEFQDVQARTNALFGEGAEAVHKWSEEAAYGLGKSAGTLQSLADQFEPVVAETGASTEKIAEMSIALAEASVNMQGLFGGSAEDAMSALRSGILGMDRPLKKFGISLSEDALQEYALSRGIHVAVKDMSEQLKIQLRYQLLQKGLVRTHGAAQAALQRLSGATAAFSEMVTELKEALGGVFLGPLTWIINAAREGLHHFLEWSKGTEVLRIAMIALGTAGFLAILPFLLGVLLTTTKLFAFIAVLDDLIAAMQSRPSALEETLNALSLKFTGSIEAGQELLAVVRALGDAFRGLGNAAGAAWMAIHGDMSGVQQLKDDWYDWLKEAEKGKLGEIFVSQEDRAAFLSARAPALTNLPPANEMTVPGLTVQGQSPGGAMVNQQNKIDVTVNVDGPAGADPDALARKLREHLVEMQTEQYDAAAAALIPATR